MNIKILIKIVLLISWMVVIFSFSNQNASESSKLSNGIIDNIGKAVLRDNYEKIMKSKRMDYTIFIVRKTAHIFLYFILSLITFSLLQEFFKINRRTIIFTILFCLLYSITDEIHQYFVPGRSCELRDILIDTTSSSISAIINYFIKSRGIIK